MASCPDLALIDEKSLDKKDWKVIGAGAFGQVFKVRHLQWRQDVAIKLLGLDDGKSDMALDSESKLMRRAASRHVIQILGIFRGRQPSAPGIQIGLVMNLMERGSLASLQKELNHPLPWSLVFQLAHQVALGMEHLHSLTPDPIIHKDLKPGNVLLDTNLNVKITDFGISKLVNAVTSVDIKGKGTPSYMPPEALIPSLSYTTTLAFDVYSYGILLWSIAKGKEPYGRDVARKMLDIHIPQGERPDLKDLKEVDPEQAPGLEDLVQLMERCWQQKQHERPLFPECTVRTEALLEKHKPWIEDAVRQVVTELVSPPSLQDQQESVYPDLAVIDEKSLDKNWKMIGAGGFGEVFKARHLQWSRDVAIKVLGLDDGSRYLHREAEMMRRAASPHVNQVLGVFRGRPPSLFGIQIGLVMELMERGCLSSLQRKLNHRLPWSLVFRLAHQVALGMKHLHSLTPPIIHKNLKPGDVLLDPDLNVKITDFGLSKFANSLTSLSIKGAGTTSYMPPEAFSLSYTATPTFDVYSYGILLCSIVKGKEPYDVDTALIEFYIPRGQRPSLGEVDPKPLGWRRLVQLMEGCWHQEPDERPLFPECAAVTEALFEKHKSGIEDAVHEVVAELFPPSLQDQQESGSE